MTAILGLLSGSKPAQVMANLATVSARPQFELTFNLVQNSIIEKLNAKITEVQEKSNTENRIDPFLRLEFSRLGRLDGQIRKVRQAIAHNSFSVEELRTKMRQMVEMTSITKDKDAFNKLLGDINMQVDGLTVGLNEAAAGITLDDGIRALRRDGAIRLGADQRKAVTFDDFLTEAAGDEDAAWELARKAVEMTTEERTASPLVRDATTRIDSVYSVLGVKAEAANTTAKNTSSNLMGVRMQIQVAMSADQAEQTEEIGKLREKYGQLLQGMSLAFEYQQAMNDRISKQLFSAPELPKGSAANLFV